MLNKDDVAVFHRQGTLENIIYLINIITLKEIIKQPRQIHKISRAGHINTRLAPNIDMSHNIPFTTTWLFNRCRVNISSTKPATDRPEC